MEHVKKEEGAAAQRARLEYLSKTCASLDSSALAAASTESARVLAEGPTEDEVSLRVSLETDSDVLALYPRVLAAVKRAAAASAAYAGEKGLVTGSSQPVIEWCVASEGCDVQGKVLLGANPDSDSADEGVTFDLFKQREEYEAEVAACDEEIATAAANLEARRAASLKRAAEMAKFKHGIPRKYLDDERSTF